jgi:hypothetical protein
MKEGKPQFQYIDQESVVPQKPNTAEDGNKPEIITSEQSEKTTEEGVSPQNTPEQIEQRKVENDPTRTFLREHGFDGDPKITYSLDTIVAVNDKGEKFAGKETFTNYEDMQEFVRNNPDAIGKKEMMKFSGIVPYRVDYDPSVYAWSSKLSKEDEQKMADAWETAAAEQMDVKNFEKVEEEKTPTKTGSEATRFENETLSSLGNPEITSTIGNQNEIDQIIRTMASDARTFENGGGQGLELIASQELARLNEYMKNGDVMKADEVLGGYVARRISNRLNTALNRIDISIPWEEKTEMLKVSSFAEKVRGRQGGMRTHDLLALDEKLDGLLKKYESKKPDDTLKQPDEKKEINEPRQEQKKENPFEKDFAAHEREWAMALNSPETGYNNKRGVAAMAEVFQGLYPEAEQMAKRMESLIKEYQTTMEKSTKDHPEKPASSHQSFAANAVIENLKEEEKKAIHKYAENNKKLGGSRNGGVSITINAELPMIDFLAHIEKIKR